MRCVQLGDLSPARYRGISGKAPGGWGFFPPIFFSQAKKKNPTPLGLFASFLIFEYFWLIQGKQRAHPLVLLVDTCGLLYCYKHNILLRSSLLRQLEYAPFNGSLKGFFWDKIRKTQSESKPKKGQKKCEKIAKQH